MTRYVAFLRGINLGKRRVEMSRLRSVFGELGLADVATFIASGNVIFSTVETNVPRLESKIAKRLNEALGYEVDTFVRTLEQVAAIAESNPFEKLLDADCVYVTFMHEALDARTARALGKIRSQHDRFVAANAEYFWSCSIRSSESRIWTSPEIRALSLPVGTTRNMTSIRKLVARHCPGNRPVPRAAVRRTHDSSFRNDDG
ncbi:MAG: DUF1697 domain-containing protein [Gemmatimonadota bacterium]|nr:DUF1697 domain-containing protein [Gemmatimonadota bacterium]